MQDLALAVGDGPHQPLEGGAILGTVEALLADPSRGIRTAQVQSRKYRLISPRIVGTAYDENAMSRSLSKRSKP